MVFFIVFVLVCILKYVLIFLSSELFVIQLFEVLVEYGVSGESICVVDQYVLLGVEIELGDGDGWFVIWVKLLVVDILVIVILIWMGYILSVVVGVFECFDVEFLEKDVDGCLIMYDKVVIVGVVGNEDGVYYVMVELYQVFNDIGFIILVQGGIYWNGEVMYIIDYCDLVLLLEEVVLVMKVVVVNVVYFVCFIIVNWYLV